MIIEDFEKRSLRGLPVFQRKQPNRSSSKRLAILGSITKKPAAKMNVPEIIQPYCDGKYEVYKKIKADPRFTLKSVVVCQDCYLQITEFNELAGGDSKVVSRAD